MIKAKKMINHSEPYSKQKPVQSVFGLGIICHYSMITNNAFFKRIVNYVFLFLVGAILLPACQSSADPSKASDFTLLNLQDESVNLSEYKGQVVLINFFSTNCPPCRLEIPDFVLLQNQYGSKGFAVIGISVDQNGKRILPRFAQALRINYPILLATSKVIRDYGNIYALPASFLIDRDHRILKHYTGMVTKAELEPIIVNALGINE